MRMVHLRQVEGPKAGVLAHEVAHLPRDANRLDNVGSLVLTDLIIAQALNKDLKDFYELLSS